MATVATATSGTVQIVNIDPNHTPVTYPEELKISKGNSEQVKWVSANNVYFTVDFGNDSPFYETQFSSDFPFSGPARRDVVYDDTREYKYTVRVAGKKHDPAVIINR